MYPAAPQLRGQSVFLVANTMSRQTTLGGREYDINQKDLPFESVP